MATAETPQAENKPYIPDEANIPEFTWSAVLVGAILGIVFGASSLYLFLKVGMTVSASVPIAVLSITLFRAFSKWFGFRRATILENNIVQTAGSAGESLAFGVGVTMPTLLLIGFEMQPIRVMTVSILGGLLGVLMMIPLRRAFIVKQHGKLKYPEGMACAEVLVAGEKGGSSARMVFIGFGIAFVYKLCSDALKLWSPSPDENLYRVQPDGRKIGLPGAAIGGDLSPELLGVGFLIGPRIACMMMAGAVISFFAIGPLIAKFGESADQPIPPAFSVIDKETGKDKGLIRNMGPGDIYNNYLRVIGAGAVAAGGIISMFRALPLIFGSIAAGLRDLRGGADAARGSRTEHDLPLWFVVVGSLGLVLVLAAVPQLGLGFSVEGILGSIMILVFGFLFVTVSSRLTGEVGSSSNPISGMTIATLLLTCLIFLAFGRHDTMAMLTSLSVSAVVCIASSNGGTTSQDLKTGYLVGATPMYQQLAILIGALTSAVVIGATLLALDDAATHYTTRGFGLAPVHVKVPADASVVKVGQPYEEKDENNYREMYVEKNQYQGVPSGWYLVNDENVIKYRKDIPIKQEYSKMDDDRPAPQKFRAPQPQLFAIIIRGILGGDLEWGLVSAGVLIAIALELMGIASLPVAVGMYLGLSTATPIFFGGMLRWLSDRQRGVSASEAETETSPGVLLSSGYIAGGTLCGLLIGFVYMGMRESFDLLDLGKLFFGDEFAAEGATAPKIVALVAFAALSLFLWRISCKSEKVENGDATLNAHGSPSPP